MATQVQFRRGTTAQHTAFTGAVGEVTVDTDKDTLVVHDGATAGGKAMLANGGALGTPSSGTVTNLTGTASININGTVGATTPATGSFTTVSASGDVAVGATAHIFLSPNGSNNRYLGVDATSTNTGTMVVQAGAGSVGFGGAMVLYGHSHATRPGYVVAGISSGSGGKFAVNTQALGGGTNVFTVDPSGKTTINDNLVIGTDGKGIDFAATPGTGTSELLDDYEEGTWTPRLSGATTAGTWTGYGYGSYRKIGNLVFLAWEIVTDATHTLSGASGVLLVSNLPFAQTGVRGGISPSSYENIGLVAGESLGGMAIGSAIYLSKASAGSLGTSLTVAANYTNGTAVYGSIVYASM